MQCGAVVGSNGLISSLATASLISLDTLPEELSIKPNLCLSESYSSAFSPLFLFARISTVFIFERYFVFVPYIKYLEPQKADCKKYAKKSSRNFYFSEGLLKFYSVFFWYHSEPMYPLARLPRGRKAEIIHYCQQITKNDCSFTLLKWIPVPIPPAAAEALPSSRLLSSPF